MNTPFCGCPGTVLARCTGAVAASSASLNVAFYRGTVDDGGVFLGKNDAARLWGGRLHRIRRNSVPGRVHDRQARRNGLPAANDELRHPVHVTQAERTDVLGLTSVAGMSPRSVTSDC